MEWNVENLFDCRHDTLKNDREFMPGGIRYWNFYRYRQKLDKIAKTIVAASGNWNPPALIGLCEVENDSTLIALTRFSALRELGYRYVMTHSPDSRGIDVALLYQREHFKLISHDSIRIEPLKGFRATRDILHVTGQLVTTDTLDIFIVHAPSRSGGEIASMPYRLHCIRVLMQGIERLKETRTNPNIVIMGDFNDFPESPSIKDVMKALPPGNTIDDDKLYHLLARQSKLKNTGTYKYQGEWNLLDHFMVSGTLLNKDKRIYTDESLVSILRLPFLLIPDKTFGGMRPFRTYYGMKYENGYSDHLPILMKVVVKKEK
jgi:endonuclease/exonuclease/phosphatase family metal-dependent hydrolase